MSRRREGLASRLVAVGAIALFVFMFFFAWFGESITGTQPGSTFSGADNSSTGWQTFTNSRWVWLATVVVALASVGAVAGVRQLQTRVPLSTIVAALGALSSLLILYRIVHHPVASASLGGIRASYGIKAGIWLGLVSALAIGVGGYLQAPAEQGRGLPPAARADDA